LPEGSKKGTVKMGIGKTKRVWLTLFYAVCLAAALAFVGYHLYELINSDIVTVRAENRHIEDTSSYIAYIARDEQTVALSDGSVRFVGDNGARFKRGDVFAYIYSADKQATLDKIAALKYENEILRSAMYYTTLAQSEAQADLCYTELMKKLSLGNTAIGSEADGLLASQLSKDYVFDRAAIRKAYEKTEDTIKELEESLGSHLASAKMPISGNLFYGGDSYGGTFSSSLALSGTADEIFSAIDEYKNADTDAEGSLCTAVKSSEWYILIPTDTDDAKRYIKGYKYTLLLGEGESKITSTLSDIRSTQDGRQACLVFTLTENAQGFDYSREFRIKVVTEEYDGYRIPFSALRSSPDGESGVYVLSGGVVLFRRVDIISTTDSYVLVKSYKNHLSDAEEGKTASKIYNSTNKESLFVGIYPGGAYSTTRDKDKLFDNDGNRSIIVKGVESDGTVDLNVSSEKQKYGYLEDNEFVIIDGGSLYHGKIPG